MPKLFKMGMAVSCLHVVGLHEPPKNTWYFVEDSVQVQIQTLVKLQIISFGK